MKAADQAGNASPITVQLVDKKGCSFQMFLCPISTGKGDRKHRRDLIIYTKDDKYIQYCKNKNLIMQVIYHKNL